MLYKREKIPLQSVPGTISCDNFVLRQLKKTRFFVLLILITFSFILLSFSPAQAANIFIFNPEGNIRQSRLAKATLEKHLDKNGISAKIFIFANPKDFTNAVTRVKPKFAIVSSYYYNAMTKQFKWKPILSGYNKNSPGFRKILVTPKTVKSVNKLRNQGIATVSLGPSTLNFVDEKFLVPIGLSTKSVRIVTVSKDIDAIMALGFGQVKGAIVTQESISTLKRINPMLVKSLKKLKVLPLIHYSKIVSFPGVVGKEKIKAAFKKLDVRGKNAIILKFFGITDFR